VDRKLRRKLNNTGNYNCEICNEQTFLVQHHIQGRKIKNANHKSNLTNICSNCHLKVHKGDIIIEKRVMSSMGEILLWHYKKESSITGEDAKPYTF